jgi:hypothetical protein
MTTEKDALIDVIESGWEDEPSAAERELANTIATNILASDWLAALLAAARAEAMAPLLALMSDEWVRLRVGQWLIAPLVVNELHEAIAKGVGHV